MTANVTLAMQNSYLVMDVIPEIYSHLRGVEEDDYEADKTIIQTSYVCKQWFFLSDVLDERCPQYPLFRLRHGLFQNDVRKEPQ